MDAYKVEQRIGVGTYGSVYLVSNKSSGQKHCLKKIRIDEVEDQEREHAETEVAILQRLNHPLILRYIDHFVYKGHLCILSEYCEGGDLYKYLRALKTPPPEAQVLEWLVQVLLAVQYVHSNNILHRDLKTQNIFITKGGGIKLGDFGISRPLHGSLDMASTIIGTPYYMSPEVMSSKPYDFKSDMWSLGCCLYEMMSLKHAFDSSDMSSLVCKVMRGEHLPLSTQFSPELRALAKTLLSCNPVQRPTPEACLKLPWLKEYVARAKDSVSRAEAHTSPSKAAPGGKPRPDSATLDKELAAAKARLAQIESQRQALSVLKGAALARLSAGRARLGTSDPSTSPAKPSAGVQPSAGTPPRPPLSAGRSPPPIPPSASPVSGGRLSGGTGSPASEPGQLLSRQHSLQGGGSTAAGTHSLDPKARREAKRSEEIRQREAELSAARRAYFEERKQAEAKKWHLIHGGSHRSAQLIGSSPDAMHRQAAGSPEGVWREVGTSSAHRSHSGSQQPAGSQDAMDDFEAELQLMNQGGVTSDPALLSTLGGPVGLAASAADRARGLRQLCVADLGAQVVDVLCNIVRQQHVQGPGLVDEEVLGVLGEGGHRYMQLVDALIFYEDLAAGGGTHSLY